MKDNEKTLEERFAALDELLMAMEEDFEAFCPYCGEDVSKAIDLHLQTGSKINKKHLMLDEVPHILGIVNR